MMYFQQLTQRQFKDLGSDRHYDDVLSQSSYKILVQVLQQVSGQVSDQIQYQIRDQVWNQLEKSNNDIFPTTKTKENY
jgi:hypothetical protein